MRSIARVVVPIFVVSTACDKDEPPKPPAPAVVDTVPAVAPAPPPPDAGPATGASSALPERPIPKPQTMVSASAPQEVQMKAIGYMVAMRAPRPDDPPADEAYASDLVEKLKPVLLSMDKGPDKPKWNRVEMLAKGRQIDLLMSSGCDAKAPYQAVVQRLNVPLTTLLSKGVLVVRCNDKKIQCLQSTREPDDVLCTTAPRHK